MKVVLNLLWIFLGGGLFIFMQYVAAGLSLCLTIVGIPWGIQAIKLSILGLVPFGHEATPTGELAEGPLGVVLNIVWLLLGGIWIFLTHLVFAALCGVTIIGIPFAVQHWKLAKLAFTPFGRELRPIRS